MDKEVENALRFQRIEVAIEQLIKESKENREATGELVEAWKSSKWFVGFVKATAALAIVLFGVASAIKKYWG